MQHKDYEQGSKQDPKFYNKNGSLTRYSFACGYIMEHKIPGYEITMWQEHGAYHVRATQQNGTWWQRIFWDVFDGDELTKARKRYRDGIKEIKALAAVKENNQNAK